MGSYIKTIFLLGILSVLLITAGGVIFGKSGIYMALIISVLMNGVSFFFSDKIALMASGAKPLDQKNHSQIYEIVEELSKKMSLPMPKLYLIKTPQANAFATGRDPQHASVAVTEGILGTLSKEELQAVLSHELSHVKNRDILIASVAAMLASAISFLANMSLFGGHSDDEDNRSGAFALVGAILVPIAASLIQMAISRQREFGADETGAKIIGSGKPLISALKAIHQSTSMVPRSVNPAFSSLYIANPLGGIKGNLLNLFSTHPPLEERVKKLQNI